MNEEVRNFLSYAHEVTRARAASFFRFDGGAREFRLAASCYDHPNTTPRTFRIGEGLVGAAAETGKPQYSQEPTRCPEFAASPGAIGAPGPILCLPLNGDGCAHGVLSLRWDPGEAPPDMSMLQHIWGTGGDLVGLVHEDRARRRLTRFEQLEGAAKVQQGLVPPGGVLGSGLEVSLVYRPFHEVGGDLLAVHERPGRTLLAIGDVAGHDTGAAMVMALVHGLLRHAAREGRPPAAILGLLNDTIKEEFGPPWFMTMLVCELDHRGHEVVVAGAGHPPALLVEPGGGPPRSLRSLDPPLGLARTGFEESRRSLRPGSTLLLHTDGIEGPLGSSQEARARLLGLLMRGANESLPALRRTLDELLSSPEGRSTDDLAVLLARLPPPLSVS